MLSYKVNSAEEAVSAIQSGQRIFIQGQAATPTRLLRALKARADSLKDIELIHLHLMGEIPYNEPDFTNSFRVVNLFVGKNVRGALDYENIDYLPCFLSEIPFLFRSRQRSLDAALIHVSPPDKHGYCSLGLSVDITRAAVETAPLVIAQINPNMPRIHGDGFIHISDIDYYLEVDDPVHLHEGRPFTDIERKIGENVAVLVEDGATLQAGIGAVPDAVLKALKNHKHLGLHSEMWSDGALELIESGAIDNSQKTVHPGKSVSSFLMGSKRLYDFVNDNPKVFQLDIAYVNLPRTIARNPKATAINSAVEVDLTGQICADSVGNRIISGVGGQVDFMRGATLSPGGKPIIAMTARSKQGASRLVAQLKQGAGVVTSRAHAHFIVTEYGAVDLFGKTLNERAKALIAIAHPDDREHLEKAWRNLER